MYDFDYQRFDQLPFFKMEPIQRREFAELASRIRTVYGVAYDANPQQLITDRHLGDVDQLWTVRSPERVRRAIQGVVKALDDGLDKRD